jgi:hypothetical protein
METPMTKLFKSTILIHYVCACVYLWHDNSTAKTFYGRTGLCIISTKWHCGSWWRTDKRSLVSQSVTGVLGGGGGRGRWNNGRPPRFPHRLGVQTRTWSPQSIAAVWREGMTVGSHPSPNTPEADIKTFPSPPPTERTGGYIEERVFGNFQNFRELRFKMSKPGFWVFSPSSGKGVNTRTDNLRVHTANSDTRTTSIGTIALSHTIVFICGDINAFGWDPRVLFWENFGLWQPNKAFGVAGVP